MLKFDHHLHTKTHSPDSSIDPLELLDHARRIGLDGVVITDHDYQWGADELADLNAQAEGLKVFSGAEVSAREGHFLVYGLPDLRNVPVGVALGDLLEEVRGQGAAVVAAHPFRWEQDFDALVADHGPAFDALELVSNNVTPATRAETRRLLGRYPMAATGSSDGHEVEVVGCYYSEFPGPIDTLADFVRAVRGKTSRPRHRVGGRLASGPVTGD